MRIYSARKTKNGDKLPLILPPVIFLKNGGGKCEYFTLIICTELLCAQNMQTPEGFEPTHTAALSVFDSTRTGVGDSRACAYFNLRPLAARNIALSGNRTRDRTHACVACAYIQPAHIKPSTNILAAYHMIVIEGLA